MMGKNLLLSRVSLTESRKGDSESYRYSSRTYVSVTTTAKLMLF